MHGFWTNFSSPDSCANERDDCISIFNWKVIFLNSVNSVILTELIKTMYIFANSLWHWYFHIYSPSHLCAVPDPLCAVYEVTKPASLWWSLHTCTRMIMISLSVALTFVVNVRSKRLRRTFVVNVAADVHGECSQRMSLWTPRWTLWRTFTKKFATKVHRKRSSLVFCSDFFAGECGKRGDRHELRSFLVNVHLENLGERTFAKAFTTFTQEP